MFDAFAVLNPKGVIALAERALMLHAVEFMLIVAIPVYFLLFFFAYRYRAGNKKAKHAPDAEHGKLEEFVWWVVPLEIVLVLGALTWGSTHQLDPAKALAGGPPVVIQVVALEWKWLFIYPEESVATVNYAVVPTGRPVEFKVTADAPMNSFWVPQLGGQIYAMTGMVTEINLAASEPGTYAGASANYSGLGFSKMKFTVAATSPEGYEAWVAGLKASAGTLSNEAYATLSEPSVLEAPTYYAHVEPNLFQNVVAQFMDARSPIKHTH